MSTPFKTNSRFACLIDDIPENKKNKKHEGKINEVEVKVEPKPEIDKFNSFKSERTMNYFNNNNNRKDLYQEREERFKAKKEFEEKEKKKKIEESLHIDNFPELNKNKKNLVIGDKTSSTNFVELFKNNSEIQKTNNNLDPDIIDLKPGNILIMMDPVTRKIITKTNLNEKARVKSEKETVKSEKEEAYETIDNFVKLHEKRTQDYIELYGYDTWEKMFKFPNWEENYSDSEDESEDEDHDDDEQEYDIDDEYIY